MIGKEKVAIAQNETTKEAIAKYYKPVALDDCEFTGPGRHWRKEAAIKAARIAEAAAKIAKREARAARKAAGERNRKSTYKNTPEREAARETKRQARATRKAEAAAAKAARREARAARLATIGQLRAAGKPWAKIGEEMGITRQAAHDFFRRQQGHKTGRG